VKPACRRPDCRPPLRHAGRGKQQSGAAGHGGPRTARFGRSCCRPRQQSARGRPARRRRRAAPGRRSACGRSRPAPRETRAHTPPRAACPRGSAPRAACARTHRPRGTQYRSRPAPPTAARRSVSRFIPGRTGPGLPGRRRQSSPRVWQRLRRHAKLCEPPHAPRAPAPRPAACRRPTARSSPCPPCPGA